MEILSATDAAGLVKNGQTIAISGVVSLLAPEAVLAALGQRYESSGAPHNLTVICPCRSGWPAPGSKTGLEHLAAPGMVQRLIASAYNAKDTPELIQHALDNTIPTYVLPMGVMFRWLRECTARSPGLLTEVGLGTFFDPAHPEAGDIRANPDAQPLDLVQRVNVAGKDCILVRSTPIDVAIVRGSVADEDGNISLEEEPISGGVRQMAMAARTSGGKVIAVVKRIVPRHSLHPRSIEIPGMLVDAVVVDPDAIQSQIPFEPAFTGAARVDDPPVARLPLNQQKIILRRALCELRQRDVVNLGVGLGSLLPSLVVEEGLVDQLTFSVEHGALGGVPAMGVPGQTGAFGAHYNPEAIIDSCDLLDFYHGGGLNATLLGFAQVDAAGNVNVARFNGGLRGPGGFIDITHRTSTLIFCGTLTSGGLDVEVQFDAAGEPQLKILQEGRHKKFLKQVEQINLSAAGAWQKGQNVLVVTERCVFRLTAQGLVLSEVAPGIDIDTQIRPMLDFELKISPDLKPMSAALFKPGRLNISLQKPILDS